ncbi:MAG: DUF488 family protein [Megasphaera sp.]|jgi:uncharacterized protein YeaO (DUF488 family)|uniref:DUF488 domain-containing protein n=1 Tax=Megasphaera sueciensis TaxID=349094 RepID=UPI003CFD52FA|nr:DUF488 family protein [Megasphaera sp.]
MATSELKLKRVYTACDECDGYRILVDRLWPRGITKERLHCEMWAKNISPSQELRKAFHGGNHFLGFKEAYVLELEKNMEASSFIALCREKLAKGNVTLVYAAKNEICNNAVVLKEWLLEKINKNS